MNIKKEMYADKIILDEDWVEYIAKTRNHELNYLVGSYRSSKTTFNILAFAIYLSECKVNGLHLVLASSASVAKTLIEDGSGFGLSSIFCEKYKKIKYKDFDAGLIINSLGKEQIILYMGGMTNTSYTHFRGLSLESIVMEEANLLHQNTITEAQGRLFASHRPCYFITENPDSDKKPSRKWLAEMQLAAPDKVNFKRVSLYDNPALSPQRIADIVSKYDPNSMFYKRYILGEDCAAEGVIYQLADINMVQTVSPNRYLDYIVVIDPGKTKSTNAMLCIGRNIIDKTIDVLYECGIRNKDNMSKPYTSVDFARIEVEFIQDCANKLHKWPKLVIVDSFAGDDAYEHLYKDLRVARIPTMLKFPMKSDGSNGKDKCEDRIRRNLDLLYRGKLRFNKDCSKTIDDMKNITYDPKQLDKGIETYIDQYSSTGHFDFVDCVDYATSFYGPTTNMRGW